MESGPRRTAYLVVGYGAVGLGIVGLFLPIMPTVPFLILSAWCFGKSDPAWEARLLADPRFGPSIRAWRERGAIPAKAKALSILMLAGSAVGGHILAEPPWSWVPTGIGLVVGGWILSRPNG